MTVGNPANEWAYRTDGFITHNAGSTQISPKSLQYASLVLMVAIDADDDKIRLAQFYAQLSKIIRNEPEFVKTTGEFKQYNSTAGQINYAGISLKGKYTGLGQTIDQAIADQIGLENVELDVDKRDDLAKILAAISWELWHE